MFVLVHVIIGDEDLPMSSIVVLQLGLGVDVQVLLVNSLVRCPLDVLHSHSLLPSSADWVALLRFIWITMSKISQ